MAQILPLPTVKASAQSLGHFVRLGETGHRQLADLHAEGRFSPKRLVVDASRIKELKVNDDALSKCMSDYSHRMGKLRAALEDFHETRGHDVPRALPIVERKLPDRNREADSA